MRSLFPILIFVSVVLYGCKIGTTGVLRGSDIDQELRNEIRSIDDIVIKAIVHKDFDLMRSTMSAGLLDHIDNNADEFVAQISNFITKTDYKIVNQFYSKNSAEGLSNYFFQV